MASERRVPHLTKGGAFGIQFGVPGVETWDSTRAWLSGADTDDSQVGMNNVFERSSPIATAIEIIAQDSASIPWELYPKGEGPKSDKPVNHEIESVWNEPNEFMIGGQLWIGTYVCRKLWGEAWWYYPDLILSDTRKDSTDPVIARLSKRLGREGGIELLDPRKVQIKIDTGEPLYFLRTAKGDLPLQRERLTLFKNYNPSNPLRGLSEITQVLIEAIGDRAAATWNARFFNEQNGIPSGMLQPGANQTVTTEQRLEILRLWNQKHGTKRTVGFLPGGWTWHDLGITRKDMDFPDLRGRARELILSRLGVPPFLAGVLEKADYANSKKQESLYWRSTISRFLNSIKDTLNHDFLPKLGIQLEAWPKMEVVRGLIEDMEAMSVIADRLWRMGIPFEQINDRLDLGFNPDEIPNSDVSFLPFSVVPSDQLMVEGASIYADSPDELDAKLNDDDEPPPEDTDKPKKKPPALPPKKALLPEQSPREARRRRLLWRQIQSQKIDLEIRMNKTVRKWMNDLKVEALDNLSGTKGWLVRHGMEPVVKADSFYLLDIGAAKVKIRKLTRPIYEQAVKRAGESIITEIGLAVDFDMAAPEVIRLIDDLASRVVRITDTIGNDLAATLREGLDAKETIEQLRDRVSGVMGASLGRSLSIARTEIGMAFTGARFESMKSHGIKQHMWLSARDTDVRDQHKPKNQGGVDGEIVAIGAPFTNGLRYPLDPAGKPEEIVNCRCIAVAVVGSASS